LVDVDGVTLTTTSANDYPRGWRAEYSTDGTTFQNVPGADGGALTGAGAAGVPTVIAFPNAVTLLAVRIVQTGASAPATSWWSIHELTVQGCVKYVVPVDGGVADGGDAGDAGDGG
jgi:hypothetical protein